jgi:hypothetical protein
VLGRLEPNSPRCWGSYESVGSDASRLHSTGPNFAPWDRLHRRERSGIRPRITMQCRHHPHDDGGGREDRSPDQYTACPRKGREHGTQADPYDPPRPIRSGRDRDAERGGAGGITAAVLRGRHFPGSRWRTGQRCHPSILAAVRASGFGDGAWSDGRSVGPGFRLSRSWRQRRAGTARQPVRRRELASAVRTHRCGRWPDRRATPGLRIGTKFGSSPWETRLATAPQSL